MTTATRDRSGRIGGRTLYPDYPDFDLVPMDLELPPCTDVSSRSALAGSDVRIDARLWFGQFSEHGVLERQKVQHYRDKGAITKMHGRIRETLTDAGIREVGSFDWFSYGMDTPTLGSDALTSTYIPLLPGPATRQQYWADYFATSAKSFEAYHHDPVAHRAVELTREFTLGKGVEANAKTDVGREAWETFWKTNSMDDRLHEIVGDLSVFGELFIRYFPKADTLVVRSLDPATIYEIVTDQEDHETVFFYHQQFQTRTELYAPPAGARGAPTGPTPRAVTKFVIRQIPAQEIDHVRINARSAEVRGRPDLFPALGYLKRLRDLMTAQVIKEDMIARYGYDLSVDGNAADVNALMGQMFPGGKPPPPGSVFAHTKAAELTGLQFNQGADTSLQYTIDTLFNLIALGIGVPKEYLGVQGHGTRATALVATEPGVKRFEDRQSVVERLLHRMADRVFDRAGLTGEDREIEFTFPGITTEDRSAMLKDLAFAESMGWVSKKSAAQTAAKELGDTTFDFEKEQDEIAKEFQDAREGVPDNDPETGMPKPDAERPQGDGKIRRPMIATQYRQEPKLDPTKPPGDAEDQPPGLLVPGSGVPVDAAGKPVAPGANGNGGPPSAGGIPGTENPANPAGAKAIRQDGKVKESAPDVIDIVEAAVTAGVREGKAPRRRPDDPDFQQRAAEFHEGTADNAKDLQDAVRPNGKRSPDTPGGEES